jgi:hypothetical protein
MNPNDSAFPVPIGTAVRGLTKREYFAVMAMQGLLGNSSIGKVDKTIIENCVKAADRLLEALDREKV